MDRILKILNSDMKNLLIVVTSLLTICSCASTTQPSSVSNSKSLSNVEEPDDMAQSDTFAYKPGNREQFVFREMVDGLQDYAYRDVCFKRPKTSVIADCISDTLEYDDYVGKKGYFTDREPFTDYAGYIAHEAILETGEVIYIVTSAEYDHVGDFIISLDDYENVSSFTPEPIVDGSDVMITGYSKLISGELKVSSQRDHGFTETEIAKIREIANKYPAHRIELAEALSTMTIEYDDFEGRTIVSAPRYNNRDAYLSLKIMFEDSGEVSSFMVAYYEADNWLFVDQFSVVAGDFRWDSAVADFSRDHTGGKIWEWTTKPLTDDRRNMLNEVASAKEAKVRFRGRQYYDDYQLTSVQQAELSRLLTIVQATR